MRTEKCNNKDIFAIRLEGVLPTQFAEKYILIYAPLSDCGIILNNNQWADVKDMIENNSCSESELRGVAEALQDEDFSKLEESRIKSVDEFCNLSILPNNKCNFSCSFCYSAKGRANDELDFLSAKTVIDCFIRPESSLKLSLSILGGGEPLLSWPLVTECINYAKQRAREFGKKLYISITTNASLATDDVIHYLIDHNITTVVSYEILEDIQNLHRGHYTLVHQRIERMFELGYTPQFNTVVTNDNVERLEEVVRKAHEDFPGLKYLCTDPVISPELFPRIEDLRTFHDAFITNYFKARKLGAELGFMVDCTANHSMDCTISRYCPGEMGITPTGLITSCPCISSEKEARFSDYVYGKVRENTVNIDTEKLSSILNKDLYSNPACARCFMKYNCGGGCMHKNNIFGNEFKPEICRFTREFGRIYLYEQINDECIKENGKSISEIMKDETY